MLDSATLTIGEQVLTIRFPLRKMVEAEKKLKKPLQTIFVTTQKVSTKAKGQENSIEVPLYELTDLITLFKVGISTDQPKLSEEQAEELLTAFLSDGKSLVVQTSILYTVLGKALGFFRTSVDIQKRISDVLDPMIEKDSN